MLKLAIGAGHGINTPGKRFLKTLDPAETREWTVNDRLVRYIIEELNKYEGVSILRTDDTSGVRDVPIIERANKANDFGANLYLSQHHNAGINGGYGGGIVVYAHPSAGNLTYDYQSKIYDDLIKATGLSGNRISPLSKADFGILRLTRMPALLIENGFMDSIIDVPIILSEEYARNSARGQVEFLEREFNLKKKVDGDDILPDNKYYRVVTGSFKSRENAESQQRRVKEAGFESFISIYNPN